MFEGTVGLFKGADDAFEGVVKDFASEFLDERWQEYLGGLQGKVVQARSMEFAVLIEKMHTICNMYRVSVLKPRAAISL